MYCLIVKRGDLERYDVMYKMFSEKMPVIWERRHGDRRKSAGDPPNIEDRRRQERRRAPQPSWNALGFVVVERNN